MYATTPYLEPQILDGPPPPGGRVPPAAGRQRRHGPCPLCEDSGASPLLAGAPCPVCGGEPVLPDFVRDFDSQTALSATALDHGRIVLDTG